MNNDNVVIQTQAECYRLIKANQEITAILQELCRLAGVDDLQALGAFIQKAKESQPEEVTQTVETN